MRPARRENVTQACRSVRKALRELFVAHVWSFVQWRSFRFVASISFAKLVFRSYGGFMFIKLVLCDFFF
jgi:hypothetical protein